MAAQLSDDRRHGVRTEVGSTVLAEPVDRLDQTDGSDLDEIVDGLRRPSEVAGERVDQREILLDHLCPRATVATAVIGRQEGRGRPASQSLLSRPPIHHRDPSPFRRPTYRESTELSTSRSKNEV